jgi:hypothetical protein
MRKTAICEECDRPVGVVGPSTRGGRVFPDPDDPSAMILHVNSGGNAAACSQALPRERFLVEWNREYDPYAHGNYGVQLRVWQP